MKKVVVFIYLLFAISCYGFAQLPEIERIKASIKTTTDSLKYVDALNRMAMLMYEERVDSTFLLAKQARAIANRHHYTKGKGDALNNLGIFFYVKGDMQLALRYYNEASEAYGAIKDSANIVQTTMNIGIVYKVEGKNKRAKQWYLAALNKGKELYTDSILSLVIYNYVQDYGQNLPKQTKLNYFNQARQIALKYKDERMLLYLQEVTANDMIKQGRREAGFKLLNNIIDSTIHKKLFHSALYILNSTGDLLMKENPKEAANMFKRGIVIAEQNGFLINSLVMAKRLVICYTQQKDDVQALVYSRKLIGSLEAQARINASSKIDYIDYAIKDQKINSLVVQSQYQLTLIIVIGIACLLAITILIVIRQSLKRTKKLNEQIISQNDKLKEALVALEQSQSENTRMLKIVAHDLRSPIAGIHSLSSLMMDEDNRSDTDQQMLKLIKESSKGSLGLVNDLLQMQFKTEELHKIPVDLAELLQYCVSLMQNSAEAKAQIINLRVKQITLLASGEKLWRVMSNLISNAIKFSPQHGSIEISMEQNAGYVRIGVSDEGIGIPIGMEHKIFEMFTDAKRTGTAGEQPFGLGLAISKQIVEAHGGKIWFERKADKGTVFIVELPLSNN